LLSARLALLSRDEDSFRQELKTAQLWTARYFDAKSNGGARMLIGLKKLAASSISIALPDISPSLQAVRNYRLTHENAKGRAMKYLVWILILFAAAVALTTASHNPAYVLLVYPPYRIELSLTLFVMLLLLTFVFGYGLVRLMLAAMQLPTYVRQFRLERAQAKARELLDEALGAFFEGRYTTAERAFRARDGVG